jgi:uncharacterized protein YndB with AHSA1/START domain
VSPVASRTARGGAQAGFRPDAPVSLDEERVLQASPEEVWTVLTRVRDWPRWHRGISFALLRGELEVGTVLHWRADGMRIMSRVAEVDPGRRVGWTMKTLGARGYQLWELHPDGSGGSRTRVHLRESWEGLVAAILRRTLRRTLARSRKEWFEQLELRSREEE